MTPGELTNRQMGEKKTREDGEQQTQFLYLSTSESEESLSSDLEAEGQQERGRVGRGDGVKHTHRRVTGQGLKVPRSDRRNIFLRYQAGEQTGRKNRASHTKQLVQKQFA